MTSRAWCLLHVWVCIAVLAGCEGCGETSEQSTTGTGSGGEVETAGEETTGAGVPVDPGDPPELRLAVEPGRGGAASLVVENHGDAPVELASALTLERMGQSEFAAVEAIQDVALRYDCETPPPECVTLIPGAALHPPPWSGDIGHAQCECERCAAAEPGTYRFVVTTCGGGHRVESPAFER